MSVSKWRYTEACDGRPCVGDCDYCSFDPEDPLTGLGREIPKKMTREEAIEQLQSMDASCHSEGEIEAIDMAIEALDRQKGEWIRKKDSWSDDSVVECSACGEEFVCTDLDVIDDLDWHFCPNCGADMRGDTE